MLCCVVCCGVGWVGCLRSVCLTPDRDTGMRINTRTGEDKTGADRAARLIYLSS